MILASAFFLSTFPKNRNKNLSIEWINSITEFPSVAIPAEKTKLDSDRLNIKFIEYNFCKFYISKQYFFKGKLFYV